jgi:DNA polymerase I-like protein with 3'-5' exonuclease and polymerase domains
VVVVDKFRGLAQSRLLPHVIDGELIDSLTWMERQRFLIDVEPHSRMVTWHERKMLEQREELRQLAIEAGWQEAHDANGELLENTKFSVDSNKMLPDLLYRIKGLKVVKMTDAGKPSTDKAALLDLMKMYPEDTFLKKLKKYKEYVALHPENLAYDRHDNSARIYLKQSTVAGGRLAASGGNFHRDGGFSLNPQAIKKVEGNWYVKGRLLTPDRVAPEDIDAYEETDLHPSCFREVDEDVVIGYREEVRIDPATGEPVLERSSDEFEDEDGNSVWDEDEIHAEGKPIIDRIPIVEKQRVRKKAPGILHNHIANYVGYSICLVPKCQTCADKHGVLLEDAKMDANEVLNFRCLFIAEKGWTFLSSDYSNIEMRIAANLSLEPKFIREFLEGDGDFHTLTAIACFPEFTLPGTSKAQRKLLRGLAKIINFALLYGGTVFTIFTNMKKEKPDITWKDAMDMVINYWDSVPIFKGFCEGKQAVARDQFLCTTELGRVVNFHSALETEGLRVPTKAEMDNNWEYIKLRKRFIRAEEEKDEEQALHLKKHMDRLWQDPESGVRNAQYFNKFLGKIQRVSVNVPFQGLAGDFMRICINRVRKWAADQEAGVQAVMRMHSSVHDELDYSVKNQYLPFVVPRITRLMKLRRLHASRKWPVPLEIDTEYGHSWDVTYHFTGDKEHMPSGWTDVEGMEKYLPAEFDLDTCAHLLRAVTSDNPAKVEKARSWMNASLHPHTANAQQAVFEDLKGAPLAVGKREKQLYALLQLHEYWTLDEVPDGDEAGMETLAQFEQRCGLTIADRGFMPEVGYLGAIPLDQVQRPVVPVLGEPEEEPEAPEEPAKSQMDMFAPVEVSPEEEEHEREEAEERERELEREEDCAVMPKLQLPPARVEHATQDTSFDLASFEEAPLAELDEDDLFLPTPKKRARAEVSEADSACVSVLRSPVQPLPTSRPANPRGLPQLRNAMTTEDFKSVMAALGFGSETLECMYRGVTMSFQWNGVNQIPKEFLADGH